MATTKFDKPVGTEIDALNSKMENKQPLTKEVILNGSGTNSGVTEITVNNSCCGLMVINGNNNNTCGIIPFYVTGSGNVRMDSTNKPLDITVSVSTNKITFTNANSNAAEVGFIMSRGEAIT